MLRRIDLTQGEAMLEQFKDCKVYVKWELKSKHHCSLPSNEAGFQQKWVGEQVDMDYKNLRDYFEFSVITKCQSEIMCEGGAPCSYFLNKIGEIPLKFKRNDKVVGFVIFETFKDTLLK